MLHAVPFEQKPALEPGVVAASVYARGQRLADIPVDDAGARVAGFKNSPT